MSCEAEGSFLLYFFFFFNTGRFFFMFRLGESLIYFFLLPGFGGGKPLFEIDLLARDCFILRIATEKKKVSGRMGIHRF